LIYLLLIRLAVVFFIRLAFPKARFTLIWNIRFALLRNLMNYLFKA